MALGMTCSIGSVMSRAYRSTTGSIVIFMSASYSGRKIFKNTNNFSDQRTQKKKKNSKKIRHPTECANNYATVPEDYF